ncbi:hypothetical protein LTR22_028136 [Elasticomyces elasticus]|nr:hypothetical protein LTR22_028136 [Elasticomyces elasticus]KAK5737613.1 hypothetical protein LTS12_025841 [Elasticomyces elasticus]
MADSGIYCIRFAEQVFSSGLDPFVSDMGHIISDGFYRFMTTQPDHARYRIMEGDRHDTTVIERSVDVLSQHVIADAPAVTTPTVQVPTPMQIAPPGYLPMCSKCYRYKVKCTGGIPCDQCRALGTKAVAACRYRKSPPGGKIGATTTACEWCKKNRIPCDGGSPCDQCTKRDKECVPRSRKRGNKVAGDEDNDQSVAKRPQTNERTKEDTAELNRRVAVAESQYVPGCRYIFEQDISIATFSCQCGEEFHKADDARTHYLTCIGLELSHEVTISSPSVYVMLRRRSPDIVEKRLVFEERSFPGSDYDNDDIAIMSVIMAALDTNPRDTTLKALRCSKLQSSYFPSVGHFDTTEDDRLCPVVNDAYARPRQQRTSQQLTQLLEAALARHQRPDLGDVPSQDWRVSTSCGHRSQLVISAD